MLAKILVLLPILLIASISINSSFSQETSITDSTIYQKFDSGFYEQIQEQFNSASPADFTTLQENVYHDVIFVVPKQTNSIDATSSSQQNKDALEKVLQENGATDIYKANLLSFVIARVPVDKIGNIAQSDFVNKLGDGEQMLDLFGLSGPDDGLQFSDLFEAKNMVNGNNLLYRGTNTNVAILDQGINENHPDLQNKIILEARCVGISGCNTNTQLSEHGTAQAGIISSTSLTPLMNGIATDAQLFDIYTILHAGSFASALDYSLTQGADVVNISLANPTNICITYTALAIIFDEAVDEGLSIIAGVGNGNESTLDTDPIPPTVLTGPSCGLNTISVGALDKDGKIWDRKTFSNRNDYSSRGPTFDGRLKPELVAPGANVYVQTYNHDDPTQLYAHQTGTSHAAPFVAGAAAVILDKKPEYTPLEIKSALLLGASWDPQNIIPQNKYPITAQKYESVSSSLTDIISTTLNAYGFGTLNVQKSLDYTEYGFVYRDFFDITNNESQKTYKIRATAGEQTKIIVSWLSHHSGKILDLASTNYSTPQNLYSNIDVSITSPSGDTITSNSIKQNNEFIIFNPQESGDYTVTISLKYPPLNMSTETFVLGTTAPLIFNVNDPDVNLNPPTITNQHTTLSIDDKQDKHNSSLKRHEFAVTAHDINSNSLSFEVRKNPTHGTLSVAEYNSPTISKFTYTYDPKKFDVISEDSFDLVAFDGLLYSNVASFKIKQESQKENFQNTGTASKGNAQQKTVNNSGYQTIPFDTISATTESQTLSANSVVAIRSTSSDVQNPLLHYTINSIPYTMTINEDSARTVIFDESQNISNVYITTEDIHEGESDGTVSVEYFTSLSQIVPNLPPTAKAGSDQSVNESTLVFLDATASIDPEGETPLRYQWHQRSGPDVTFIGGGFQSSQVSFYTPSVSEQTILTFEVQVKDPHLTSDIDTVSIIVNDVPVISINNPPISKAGVDQTIDEGSLVILDGRKSYDPEGAPLTYAWLQTAGESVVLSHRTSAVSTFTAPLVTSDATLTFQLTVSDRVKDSVDAVNIIVNNVATSKSALPLIVNPFPDHSDKFGYSVSSTNDGNVIIGAPYEDNASFPENNDISQISDGAIIPLSSVIQHKTFAVHIDDTTSTVLFSDYDSSYSFVAPIYHYSANTNHSPESLKISIHDTMITLLDSQNSTITSVFQTQQHNLQPLHISNQTIHNNIILFTDSTADDTAENSAIIFDGTTGNILARVAQNSGAVYIFDKSGNLLKSIPNPSPGSSDQFGYSVSSAGDSGFAVGVPESDYTIRNGGIAYLYKTTHDVTPIVLSPQTPKSTAEFGYAISSGKNIILVGSPEGANGGTATIFDITTGTRLVTLQNPTQKKSDDFGKAVAVSDKYVIVGAPYDDTISNGAGIVYLYDNTGSFAKSKSLKLPQHGPFDYFGKAVSAESSHNNILVGATGHANNGIISGSAFLFDGNTGDVTAEFANISPKSGEKFGQSVAFSKKYLLIGDPSAMINGTSIGAISLYDISSHQHLKDIYSLYPDVKDNFGNSISRVVGTDAFVVGSPDDDAKSAVSAGTAYLFYPQDIFSKNNPPIAFAGSDQTVPKNTIVTLNATGSIDVDGDVLSYHWSQNSGNNIISLVNSNARIANFTAPNTNLPDIIQFTLTVNDGTDTSTDVTTITVNDPDANSAPILGTITNQTVNINKSITVPISAIDAENDRIVLSAPLLLQFSTITDHTNGTGKIIFAPQTGDVGEYPVTVRATDFRNSTLYNEKSFYITVNKVTLPPIARNDNATTLEDTPIQIDVLSNDQSQFITDDTKLAVSSVDGITNNENTFVAYYADDFTIPISYQSVLDNEQKHDDITHLKQQLQLSKESKNSILLKIKSLKQDYKDVKKLYKTNDTTKQQVDDVKNNIINTKKNLQETKDIIKQIKEKIIEQKDITKKSQSKNSNKHVKDIKSQMQEQRSEIQSLKAELQLSKESKKSIISKVQSLKQDYKDVKKLYKTNDTTKQQVDDVKNNIINTKKNLQELNDTIKQIKEKIKNQKDKIKISKQIKDTLKEFHLQKLAPSPDVDSITKSIISFQKNDNTSKTESSKVDISNQEPHIAVYITTNTTTNDTNVIHTLAASGIMISSAIDGIISTIVTESQLDAISKIDDVVSVDTPHIPQTLTVTSQGVTKSHADSLHNKGIEGDGITVAIIDDSFILSDENIAGKVSYSALFDSIGYCDGKISCSKTAGNSHGTATAQIVSDMAPQANLELYAITNSVDFVNAISHIITRNTADVVSISLGFPTLGGDGTTGHFRDGTSHVAKAVDLLYNSGISVVTASGNDAQRHWSGQYRTSDTITPSVLGLSDSYQGVMEFQPNESGLQKACLPINHGTLTVLTWNDWRISSNDYDLLLYDNTMSNVLRFSNNPQQLVPSNPIETIMGGTPINSACVVIASKDTTQNHKLDLYAVGGMINDNNNIIVKSITTPADARHSITVGAVSHTSDTLESFSSVGPTDDGRPKPEICGYDGVTTSQSRFDPFFGTSASAPHVAGAMALIKQANPSASPSQLEGILLINGTNNVLSQSDTCGAGILNLELINSSGNNNNGNSNTSPSQNNLGLDTLEILSVNTIPRNGTALITNNTITYTPNQNYFGDDTFSYTITDGSGKVSSADVAVNVLTINDTPMILPMINQTMVEQTIKNITIHVTDADTADVLTITNYTMLPSFASLIDHSNRTASLILSPTKHDSGVYNMTLHVADSGLPEKLHHTESFFLNVTDADVSPPVITLLGDVTITVPLGSQFTDPGVVVIDNVDGDMTLQVTINNNLNTLLPDTYTIIYSVTDSSGNHSTTSRTVIVSNIADSISTVYGDGSDGNLEVKSGQTITLSGKKQFSNVIIRGGGTITAPQGTTLDIRVNGTLVFEENSKISVDDKGMAGGNGGKSEPGKGGAGGSKSNHSRVHFVGGTWWSYHYAGLSGGPPQSGHGYSGELGDTGFHAGSGGNSAQYNAGTIPAAKRIGSFDSIPNIVSFTDEYKGGSGGSGGAGSTSGNGGTGGGGSCANIPRQGYRCSTGATGGIGVQSAIGGAGGNGGGVATIYANVLHGPITITAAGNDGELGESAYGASIHGAGGGGGGAGGIISIIYSKVLQQNSIPQNSSVLEFDILHLMEQQNKSIDSSVSIPQVNITSVNTTTINVNGGTGGSGGNGLVNGQKGHGGYAGNGGIIFTKQITGLDSAVPQIKITDEKHKVLKVLYGVTSVDYFTGVTVTDNDPNYFATLKVDSSNVDTSKFGNYTVIYTATSDAQGNIPKTFSRMVQVIPNPIFGYGTLGSIIVNGDITIPSGIHHYQNMTINENSNLITNGKTIIFVNDTYSQSSSGKIIVKPTGCAGGNGGTTQGGSGGSGGGYCHNCGWRGSPVGFAGGGGGYSVTTSPKTALACTTLDDAASLVGIMDVSDTFVNGFTDIMGGAGSDGTGAASSGRGGDGASGSYVRLHGSDFRTNGHPGGAGGTGAQGVDGVFGGGTIAIFAKIIDTNTLTINAKGSPGNDGNQGTGDPGDAGYPGGKVRFRGYQMSYPASYPGSAASTLGTIGSAGSDGGLVYVGYGKIVKQGFAPSIDVSGGIGGYHGLLSTAQDPVGTQRASSGTDGAFHLKKVADVIPPILSLVGEKHVTLEYGMPYVDAGATAIDDVDGNITSKITTDNSVNSTVGRYHVTYDVTDTSANQSPQLVRTVDVVDTKPPVITINGSNTILAEYGGYSEDDIDVLALALSTIPSDENSVIISAADPIDGILPVTILFDDTNLFQVGNYTVTYTAQDKNGNTAAPANLTILVQDTIPPAISLVGSNFITTHYGEDTKFTDPGIIAADPVDGDLTSKIIINHNINHTKIGNYTVTYTVFDANGNSATLQRIVEVFDNVLSTFSKLPFEYVMIGSDDDTKNNTSLQTDTIFLQGINMREEIVKSGKITSQLDSYINGSAIMDWLDIPEYDLDSPQHNSSSIFTITSIQEDSQYAMTPPVKQWIANQSITMNVDNQAMPDFGGLSRLEATPVTNGSSNSDWLVVQVHNNPPQEKKMDVAEISYDMFVDIQYPYDELVNNSTIDWSKTENHATKPEITLFVPKPDANTNQSTTAQGCLKVEPLYYDESTSKWITGHATILSNVPSVNDEKFCTVTMQVNHFSSFALIGTISSDSSSIVENQSNTVSSSPSSGNNNNKGSSGGGSFHSSGSPVSAEAIARLQEIKNNVTLQNDDDDNYNEITKPDVSKSDVITQDHSNDKLVIILSPRQQIVNGVEYDQIICIEDLQLIFKVSDGLPVCVNEQSIPKLVQRGWAKLTI